MVALNRKARIMLKSLSSELVNSLGLSVAEACGRSSIGRTTFYKLLKNGQIQIPAHKCGRRTIIFAEELRQAFESLPRLGGTRERKGDHRREEAEACSQAEGHNPES